MSNRNCPNAFCPNNKNIRKCRCVPCTDKNNIRNCRCVPCPDNNNNNNNNRYCVRSSNYLPNCNICITCADGTKRFLKCRAEITRIPKPPNTVNTQQQPEHSERYYRINVCAQPSYLTRPSRSSSDGNTMERGRDGRYGKDGRDGSDGRGSLIGSGRSRKLRRRRQDEDLEENIGSDKAGKKTQGRDAIDGHVAFESGSSKEQDGTADEDSARRSRTSRKHPDTATLLEKTLRNADGKHHQQDQHQVGADGKLNGEKGKVNLDDEKGKGKVNLDDEKGKSKGHRQGQDDDGLDENDEGADKDGKGADRDGKGADRDEEDEDRGVEEEDRDGEWADQDEDGEGADQDGEGEDRDEEGIDRDRDGAHRDGAYRDKADKDRMRSYQDRKKLQQDKKRSDQDGKGSDEDWSDEDEDGAEEGRGRRGGVSRRGRRGDDLMGLLEDALRRPSDGTPTESLTKICKRSERAAREAYDELLYGKCPEPPCRPCIKYDYLRKGKTPPIPKGFMGRFDQLDDECETTPRIIIDPNIQDTDDSSLTTFKESDVACNGWTNTKFEEMYQSPFRRTKDKRNMINICAYARRLRKIKQRVPISPGDPYVLAIAAEEAKNCARALCLCAGSERNFKQNDFAKKFQKSNTPPGASSKPLYEIYKKEKNTPLKTSKTNVNCIYDNILRRLRSRASKFQIISRHPSNH